MLLLWTALVVALLSEVVTCTGTYYSAYGSVPYSSPVIPAVYSSYSSLGPSSVHHHHHHHHYYPGKSPYGGSTAYLHPTASTSSVTYRNSWPAHSYSSSVFSSGYPSTFGWYPGLTGYHQILKTTVPSADNSTTADGEMKVGNKTEHVFKNKLASWPYWVYQPFWTYQGSIQHFPVKKEDGASSGSSQSESSPKDSMEKEENDNSEELADELDNKEATTAAPSKSSKIKKNKKNKRNQKSTKIDKK